MHIFFINFYDSISTGLIIQRPYFPGVHGQDGPKLQIQPPSVTKEVGASLALACRPVVPDPNLVTMFEWRDPKGRRLNMRNSDAPVYVQQIPGDPGLSLIISSLTENQAGEYSCHAMYANTESISATVDVKTYGNRVAESLGTS